MEALLPGSACAAIAGASSSADRATAQVPLALPLGGVRTAGFVAAAFRPPANLFVIRLAVLAVAAASCCHWLRPARSIIAIAFAAALGGRMARALSVLRERGSQEYRRRVHLREESRMNWKRTLGLDNLAAKSMHSRGANPPATLRRKKIPDHWVPTTCGYCSVGCGMEIGVKDGQAVASRPFAIASGQPRQALPQGPVRTLHHRRRKPRQVSAAAQERQAGARRLGRSARRHGRAFPRHAGQVRPGIAGRDQHRPAGHRRVLHARQAGAARLRHQQLRRQHHALHGHRGLRLQAFPSAAMALPAPTKIWRRPT